MKIFGGGSSLYYTTIVIACTIGLIATVISGFSS